MKMILDLVTSNGVAGRWALGAVIVIHLVAYNQTGGVGAIVALVTAGFSAILAVSIRNGVKNVQIAYLRATHKFDFFCLYLALWMDIFALLAACGALVRTLSTCLDAMTGGLARIYILGRNSPQNEPWPDVLGVGVVFVITGMFMLGLENTNIFTFLMGTGVLGIMAILSAMGLDKGDTSYWAKEAQVTSNPKLLVSGAALCSFVFPTDIPARHGFFGGIIVTGIVLVSNLYTAGILSELVPMQTHAKSVYEAVPMLSILEEKSFHKALPAIACMLVISCSGALLDLFPEMYNLIVKLTKPDYKIVARQIGYENRDSGSPVLAVFTGGSFCAMLAFACPLEDMTYIMAGSHLVAILARSLYLIYQPFRPKFSNTQQNGSTLSYSRLDVTKKESKARRLIGLFNKAASQTYQGIPKSLSKSAKLNKEVEREWLLLGEPPLSPRAPEPPADAESSILSDPSTSDIECIAKPESESESTTDIDAIVDEYRQKVKVSTVGPTERLPSPGSWWIAIFLLAVIFGSTWLTSTGIVRGIRSLYISGPILALIAAITLHILPRYQTSSTHPLPLTCTLAILMAGIQLGVIFSNCWGPLVIWFLAAVMFYVRCDNYICACIEHPSAASDGMTEVLISGRSHKVNVPYPPVGPDMLHSNRILAHR